ncbi:MAG: helix-turn-helix domain-containing protein [Firmicutes bacterium]|jgi:DNA-binding transcriptional ArsR family regulator|nr:helix-turn-helix domain-containing protein [Bacillota bacterium]
MEDLKIIDNLNDIKVFTDPYRLMILKNYYEKGKSATVKQIADMMGETPAKVHYHVKKMLKAEILELEHEEIINGIIAKYYIPTAKKFEISNDNIDSEVINKLVGNNRNFAADVIDQFKSTFTKNLGNESNKGILISSKLYLNREDAEKLEEFLKELQNKHNEKDLKCEEYEFFCGMIKSI